MSRRQDVQSADGVVASLTPDGRLFFVGRGAPSAGFVGAAKGCLYLDLTNGVPYYNAGTAASATWVAFAPAVTGVAAGYKIARGVATITGSGTVVTGLTTVVAVTATMQADASLTNGISVTATIGDQAGTPAAGSVILKVWKPTASGDVTPIASAAAVAVNWVAWGT